MSSNHVPNASQSAIVGNESGLEAAENHRRPGEPTLAENDILTQDLDLDSHIRQEPTIDSSLPSPEVSEDGTQGAIPRTKDPITGCYTSSIYVDAFDLALDTVLKEEAYLFDPEEQEIFAKYRSLDYEPRYIYVRLFLRKTNAWFRINRLQYSQDVRDIGAACAALQDPAVGLADAPEVITLEEAAALLSLEELKAIAKERKFAGSNKVELISQLSKLSKSQGSLKSSGGQLKLDFDSKGNYRNREKQEVCKILEKTGPCIRISSQTSTLFNRVHLVFYRSAQWTEKSLTTVILARTLRRNFPSYIVSRTSSIFPSRNALVAYETALNLQNEVDDLLQTPSSQTALSAVLEIFQDLYPIWKTDIESTPGIPEDDIYLLRFTALWVQTRIIHKGAYVLGRLHKYAREHEVLTCLLSQTPYHPSRRGAWYTRMALLEEKHLSPKDARSHSKLRPFREASLSTCCRGLQDPQTHLIYHHALQERIRRLERLLKVPKQDQHDFSHVHLTQPLTTTIRGTRLSESTVGGKTIWQHPLDGSDCSVEELALAHYAQEGFSGMHDEGRIIKTIFAAIFFDILFLPVPNVFQTEFQTAPLDLFTDAFYPGRASEIHHRLAHISSGGAPELLRSFWEAESERQTCVVGLDWTVGLDACIAVTNGLGPDAVSGICRVLCEEYRVRTSGMPDLTLWKNGENGWEARLVEVKSENDRLSETQRVWGSVLRGFGITMEVCWVREFAADDEDTVLQKRSKKDRAS